MKKFGILIAVTSITASLLTAMTLAAPSQAATCKSGALNTLNKGVLTIGTDNPAYSPWFEDNTPSNGKGFESAVAYAVAKQLGYPKSKVKWAKAPFNAVIQPGKKSYDFDINEVSITPERAKAVDFSSGYYDVAQAIVTVAGSKIAKAKSIKDLANAKLGAAVGTTSYTTITSVIKPKIKAAVYDTNDVATQALINGQIDGLVLDLPTAFYVAYVQLKKGAIVGQFAAKAGGEQFGLVLTKESPLTSCVSRAVDALRANGTLKAIATKWLSSSAGVPVLK
ncbi:MAG: amino acid ABC transporter substrate-binding protein [Actinobacteria bacterium]|nr:amino acid ABC transporter substrate-binding protein [Actinomycetota bacterium]